MLKVYESVELQVSFTYLELLIVACARSHGVVANPVGCGSQPVEGATPAKLHFEPCTELRMFFCTGPFAGCTYALKFQTRLADMLPGTLQR